MNQSFSYIHSIHIHSEKKTNQLILIIHILIGSNQINRMGAVVSCIANVFRAIGSCLITIVNAIGTALRAIIDGIVTVLDLTISCVTCGAVGRRRHLRTRAGTRARMTRARI